MTDTSTEAVERLAFDSFTSDPVQLSATLRALAAERDALRAEVENAKLNASLLAFTCGSLASRAEAAEAKQEQARVDALREAVKKIRNAPAWKFFSYAERDRVADVVEALIDKETTHD